LSLLPKYDGKKQECSFLKKRTKKLLCSLDTRVGIYAPEIKGFLLLFFKKEVLSFLPGGQAIDSGAWQ
jgi:hypothetical protein